LALSLFAFGLLGCGRWQGERFPILWAVGGPGRGLFDSQSKMIDHVTIGELLSVRLRLHYSLVICVYGGSCVDAPLRFAFQASFTITRVFKTVIQFRICTIPRLDYLYTFAFLAYTAMGFEVVPLQCLFSTSKVASVQTSSLHQCTV
jgi:hypothetical protein